MYRNNVLIEDVTIPGLVYIYLSLSPNLKASTPHTAPVGRVAVILAVLDPPEPLENRLVAEHKLP
jgi:hypothetical protein